MLIGEAGLPPIILPSTHRFPLGISDLLPSDRPTDLEPTTLALMHYLHSLGFQISIIPVTCAFLWPPCDPCCSGPFFIVVSLEILPKGWRQHPFILFLHDFENIRGASSLQGLEFFD